MLRRFKVGSPRSEKNLLEFSVEAVRARATVGEISMALEEIYGRFEGIPRISKNVYSSNFKEKR